jgi:hypothetical protein
MKVFEWSRRYGLSLHTARYAEDSEEQDLTHGRKMYTTGHTSCLNHLSINTPEIQEIMGRSPVGYTYDQTKLCYAVTDEEWDMLIKLELETAHSDKVQALEREAARCRSLIASYEKSLSDKSLCPERRRTKEEASVIHKLTIDCKIAKQGLQKALDMLEQLNG